MSTMYASIAPLHVHYAQRYDVGPAIAKRHVERICSRLFKLHPDELTPAQHRALWTHIERGDIPPHDGETLSTLEEPVMPPKATPPDVEEAKAQAIPDTPAAPEAKAPARPGAMETVTIPVGKIDPFKHNSRKHFDQAELEKLGASLKADGQLQNCVVRIRGHRYELIAGERRWRAAKLAKLAELRCVVLDVDDAKAVELSGMENYQRQQLDAVEEARWFRQMLDVAGYTQGTLAAKLKITQGLVSQRLALLGLPDVWQVRIITGVIPATWARELTRWNNRPAVLEVLDRGFAKEKPDDLRELVRLVAQAVDKCSRPLSGWFNAYDEKGNFDGGRDVAFKATPTQREQLQIEQVTSDRWGHKVRAEPRAFNVELWEQLQAAGEARKAEREAKQQERIERKAKSATASPADKKRSAKAAADMFGKRLHRWRTKWLQAQIAKRLPDADDALVCRLLLHFSVQDSGHRDSGDLRDAAKAQGIVQAGKAGSAWGTVSIVESPRLLALEVLSKWVQHETEGYRADITPADVESIAAAVGVDIKRDWELTRDFLELHTSAQLIGLAKEWKLSITPGKRAAMLNSILMLKPKACPAELLNLKAPKR